VYLGRIVPNTCTIDLELDNRISRACIAFGRQFNRMEEMWDTVIQNAKFYRDILLTTLLYACETSFLIVKCIVQQLPLILFLSSHSLSLFIYFIVVQIVITGCCTETFFPDMIQVFVQFMVKR